MLTATRPVDQPTCAPIAPVMGCIFVRYRVAAEPVAVEEIVDPVRPVSWKSR